ncbi:MAG: carboxyl transferase domain-containing protein, partial [Dehalococcoidia bacterium]
MRQLISYGAYLTEKERLRRRRSGKIHLKPLPEVPIEDAVCYSCGAELHKSDLYQQHRVCEVCGFHHSLSAYERIYILADPASFEELDLIGALSDPSKFIGNESYQERIREAQERTGLSEAVVTGTCTIGGNPTVIAVLDFGFLGGNMGMVVGDRIARAFDTAVKQNLPIVTVVSSGGARIEEGVLSLVQMAKTVAVAKKLDNNRLPHISILTHPTTGEVYASFANLGDVIFAEPKAMIGFAPIRTLQQSADDSLSEMDHTAESHLEHGLIDQIVDRTRLRNMLSVTLDLLSSRYRLGMKKKVPQYFAPTNPPEQAWDTIQLARHEARPTALDYIFRITSAFVEIHGDRSYSDDPAVVCGFAELGGQAVVIIGQQGDRNEGHTSSEGFRKARRGMKLAAKFGLPLITLIDTPGAYPGPESEERGIGHGIASTMALLIDLPTPVISVIIGEGGSEGALALGIANRVLIMENAYLSVVSPERAASIFSRDTSKASSFASALRLTAADCRELGVVDVIVPEPRGGAHTDHVEASRLLRNVIIRELLQIQVKSP